MSAKIKKEATKLLNFQMPFGMYMEVEGISVEYGCSMAEVVRQAIVLLLERRKSNSE